MRHQAWFVNWFCSSFLYMNAKKTDYNRFYICLKDLKIFPITRFLVTRYFVTLGSNTHNKLKFSHALTFQPIPWWFVAIYKQK